METAIQVTGAAGRAGDGPSSESRTQQHDNAVNDQ